jgi:hypothetical protein
MTTPQSAAPAPTPIVAASSGLLKSTMLAALIAGAILTTVVLPAEYGVDPTRVGAMLGLKEMGEIKMRLAKEDAEHETEAAAAAATPAAPAIACPPTPADSAGR